MVDYIERFSKSLDEHIQYVIEAGEKLGIPRRQLLCHDQSKWSPEEFGAYAQYHPGRVDPVGYAKAWLHHIHQNPHHWQYYMFPDGYSLEGSDLENGVCRMPSEFVVEMVADWMGASMAYTNSWDMTDWLIKNLPKITLHSKSVCTLFGILDGLGYKGERYGLWSVKPMIEDGDETVP